MVQLKGYASVPGVLLMESVLFTCLSLHEIQSPDLGNACALSMLQVLLEPNGTNAINVKECAVPLGCALQSVCLYGWHCCCF